MLGVIVSRASVTDNVAQRNRKGVTQRSHLSLSLAERAGFEPATPFGVHDFQSCALDQLCDLSTLRDYNNPDLLCQRSAGQPFPF
jgi:hypothetical protein